MAGDDQSLLDWVSDEDYRFRSALEPINLVVELNFTADGIRTAQSR